MSSYADQYVLDTGEQAAARLRLTQEIWGADGIAALQKAGLRPGMRALDVGCGVGSVAQEMARIVGPTGSVIGADLSSKQVDVAARDAEAAGLTNLSFQVADAYHTGFPSGHFDLIHCRLLLIHLGRPLEALREWRRLLKPGGVVVCEDISFRTIFSEPRCEALEEMVALTLRMAERRQMHPEMGVQLPSLLRQAGFSDVQLRVAFPLKLRGEAKRWLELTFVEQAASYEQTQVATAERIRQLGAEVKQFSDDETTLIGGPAMTMAWARPV